MCSPGFIGCGAARRAIRPSKKTITSMVNAAPGLLVGTGPCATDKLVCQCLQRTPHQPVTRREKKEKRRIKITKQTHFFSARQEDNISKGVRNTRRVQKKPGQTAGLHRLSLPVPPTPKASAGTSRSQGCSHESDADPTRSACFQSASRKCDRPASLSSAPIRRTVPWRHRASSAAC